jgi:hypothetical protein
VDGIVENWKEFNLPFIKGATIQWLAFLEFAPSQQAVCTEKGH